MTSEKYLKIYLYLIQNDLTILTKKDLGECQISSYDINQLLKDNILIRLQHGQYFLTPKAISQMYYLKDEITKNLGTKELSKVIGKVNQLKKNYEQFYQTLMLFSIKNNNFQQAWIESSHLMHSDKNIYHYLLSFLMKNPHFEGKGTSPEDLYDEFKIISNNPNLGKLSNQIRYKIANEQFKEAQDSLNLAISQGYLVMSSNELVKELLIKIQKNEEKISQVISSYLEKEDYEQIVETLKEISKTQRLTKASIAIMVLAKNLMMLNDTKVPLVKNAIHTNTDYYLTAIQAKDFLLAKKLIEKKATSLEKIPSYPILVKILDTFIAQNTSLNRMEAEVMRQEALYDLEGNQLPSFFLKLREYLIKIEKLEYEKVVRNIVKLDILNQNDHFVFTKDILTKLSSAEYSYSLANQLANFYQAMIDKKGDVAKVYLDILLEYSSITGKELMCDQEIKKLFLMEEKKKMMNPYQPLTKKEKILLQNMLDSISRQGIYLFKPMNQWQIREIYQAINKLEGIYCFEVGPSYARRIVAKSYTTSMDMEQVKEYMRVGEAMYQSQEYDFSIFSFQQALKAKSMDAWLYARLGISCKNSGINDLAVTYLIIAQELTRNKTHKYDFSKIIEELTRGKVLSPHEVARRNTPQYINNTMFKNVRDNHYGINNLHQIVYAISKNTKLDDVVQQFNLSDEDKCIALLITAREYYYLDNDLMGDRYFMQVEKMKNKSRRVIALFEEIRRKKRFYKNHEESSHQSLLEEPKQKVLK